ncbi:hypothetical protein BU046_04540 [Staphylococcus simulans]|nr:hypothetical protein BU045_09980 [Staphylococcus simulans]PTJ05552.1 hypothetical protein BU046_04540 [Staphylococcus simulans]PTJ21283.1 hypothetical protein BU039_12855 [Staphylococcus simulans]PTJ95483.1 hypothetical protein BU013_11235 [Staphylococcus simulans]
MSPARLPIPPRRHNMERKIGFTPIPRSGKERVLRVELLPHKIKNGAENRIYTYTSFREGTCSKS